MHAGFQALRSCWPMNISAVLPGHRGDAEVNADLARICAMWDQALADSGGPFLFGPFGAADAMYAPVVTRFKTYQVDMPSFARAYCERVLADHAVSEWCRLALAETEFIAADEPYRSAPAKI
jgi:glutathione S-transferase